MINIEKLKHLSRSQLLFVFLFVAFGVIVPICYLSRPLHVDESTFLVIGNCIKDGSVLYQDVANNKPPGVFYLAAFVFSIVGKSFIAMRILTFVVHAASALLVFALGKKIAGRNVGMIASILFLIGVYLLSFQGYCYLTEPYVVFFCILSVSFFLREKYYAKFIAGLALGMGIVFKQTTIFLFGVFFLFYLLQLRFKQYRTKEYVISSAKNLVIIFLGIAIPLLIVFIYFLAIGTAEGMLYYMLFSVPGVTPSSLLEPLQMALDFFPYLPVWLLSIGMALIVGYKFLRGKTLDEKRFLLSLWLLVFSFPAIIGGSHRILFIIPPAALLAALLSHDIYNNLRRKCYSKQLKRLVIVIFICTLVISTGVNIYLFVARSSWSVQDQIRAAHEVEEYVDGKMYAFPFQNFLFFFSNSTPSVTVVGGVYSEEIAEQLTRDLQVNNVDYVVAVKSVMEILDKGEQILHFPSARQIIYDYIQENYQQVEIMEYFIIYKLKEDN